MAHKYKKIFSYYGGKSKIAAKYPEPIYDIVIEPFAGGASYSLLHYDRYVQLNDKDIVTSSVWRFLLRTDALELIHRYIPTTIIKGTPVTDLVDDSVDEGLVNLIRAEFGQGSLGLKNVRHHASPWAARDWHQVLPRLDYWVPRISHWQLTSLDYSALENTKATWFIDPPYANAAGSIYRTNDVNYEHLGTWCQTRRGEAIVCENEGAQWLDFRFLTARAGCFTGRDDQAKASGGEVVWIGGVR